MNLNNKITIFLLLCSAAFGSVIRDDEKFATHNTYDIGTNSVRGKNIYFVNIDGTTLTDGTATFTGGNLTSMGNITGTDVDISAGTGDFSTSGTGTFGQIVDNGLTALRVVFTDGSKQFTSTPITSGTGIFWDRTGTTLTTTTAGDDVTVDGVFTIGTSWTWLGDTTTTWSDDAKEIQIADNTISAVEIRAAPDSYFDITTTNGSEALTFGNATTNPDYDFLGTGTVSVGGDVDVTGDVTCDELTITNSTQDWLFTGRTNVLQLASQTSGQTSLFEMITADSDGTDYTGFRVYKAGDGVTIWDLIDFVSNTDGSFLIRTLVNGGGFSLSPIILQTGANDDQLLLAADGDNSMSGSLVVDGSVDVANNDASGQLTILDEDQAEKMTIKVDGGLGKIAMEGTTPLGIDCLSAATGDWKFFKSAAEGETKEVQISGWKTGEASRSRVDLTVDKNLLNTFTVNTIDNTELACNLKVTGSHTVIIGTTVATAAAADLDVRGDTRLGDATRYFTTDDDGNSWWVSTGSGLVYGHMYISGADIVVDTSGTANPVEVKDDGTTSLDDGWTAGELNETVFAVSDLHYVTITKPGKYEVPWSLAFATAAGGGTVIHGGIMIDGTAIRDNGEDHTHVFNANNDQSIGTVGIIDCPNGTEEISLWISNNAAQDTDVEHGNMLIRQIGGT